MRIAAAALALSLALPAAARARGPAPFVDPRHGYEIALPDGWETRTDGEAPPGTILLARNPETGQVLVVSRAVGPTGEAEGKEQLALLEERLASSVEGYRRLSRRVKAMGRRGRVSALDLWFKKSRGKKRVIMGTRFLVYPGYVLSVAVDCGSRRETRTAREIIESFQPARQ